MEQRIHRRQNDYSAAGSTHTPLPHHRNRQRVFPLQTKYSQCKDQNTAAGKRKILTRRKSGQFVVNYNQSKTSTGDKTPTQSGRLIHRCVVSCALFSPGQFSTVTTSLFWSIFDRCQHHNRIRIVGINFHG